MPVQIVGNQPTTAIPYTPKAEPINNPRVFSRINEPTARNWNSLGRPTNLPEFQSRPPLSLSERLSGRSPAQISPQVGRVTPSSIPSGNPNLSARLAGRSPEIVPSAISNPVADSIVGRVPSIRVPSGSGLFAAAAITSLPRELPRLAGLIRNPSEYWREELERQRSEAPELYSLFAPNQGRSSATNPTPRPAQTTIPFEGGQTPGTYYSVGFRLRYKAKDGTGNEVIGDGVAQVWGPIRGTRETVSGASRAAYIVAGTSSTDPSETLIPLGSTSDEFVSTTALAITSANRISGNPDTGGNPSPVPVPGATNRPALASPTSPYIAPTPSRSPTSVPFNNPSIPIGSPAGAPNPLTPAATAAPQINPNQARPTPANPLAPAGAPQQRPAHQPASESNAFSNGTIIAAAAATALVAALGYGLSRRTTTTTSTPTTPTTPTTEPPTFTCRFRDDPYSERINTRTTEMNRLELAIQGYQTEMLQKLDDKLGNQIVGGISGKLGRMANLASKTWNFLQVDRALAVFTWIGVLHNAYMLSNNLGQTLFSAIGTTLDAVGIQKVDEEGNESPYDVGEIVAKYTDNFAKNIFGVSTWEGIKADWKKLNRIYQAATNLLNSLQSMTYAILEGVETVGNYVAKIGNAARIFGVFTEKAFNPMRDNLNFKGGKFFRFLERSEEFVQNIESISSNVVDIQQTAADCSDQSTELKKGIADFEKSRSDEEKQKKINSVSPPIAVTDQQKPAS